jgi:hypothetical protein
MDGLSVSLQRIDLCALGLKRNWWRKKRKLTDKLINGENIIKKKIIFPSFLLFKAAGVI